MNVLVTRPDGQQSGLQQQLKLAGFDSRHLALLEIQSVDIDAVSRQIVLDLDQFDGIVVVSPNAAIFGMEIIEQYWPQFPLHQHWVTNGETTKGILDDFGLNAIIPVSGTATEDLVNLTELQNIENQKWLIIRGVGGRELLTETLKSRGATVTKLEVYKRSCPKTPKEEVTEALKSIQSIMISSAEALQNLHNLADGSELEDKMLIVSSPRLLHIAKMLHWKNVILADGASNTQMIQALKTTI